MRVLSRYIFKEFFKIMIICTMIFVAVYLVIDFLQKIDNFIEAGVPNAVMGRYYLFKVPYIVMQLLPSVTLISVVILFSIMLKNREVMALKACGVNLYSVFRKLSVAGICLSVGLFFFSEYLVRYASAKSNEIWTFDVEKRDPGKYYYGYDQIWYRGADRIYWIWAFDRERYVMDHPTLFFFDENFRLKRRIAGEKGVWANGVWIIHKGYEQVLGEDGDYRLNEFGKLEIALEETPETFIRPEKQPEEMSFWELWKYAEKVRLDGYDNTKHLVDMHIKVAFPFVLVIMVVIGLSVPLMQRETHTPLSVAVGMGLCFLYMLLLGFSRSLGLSGVMPPILAAWLSNLVFLLFALYLMMRVER